ncbi:hypothetical protein KEJ39_07780 [Candidatus Bathyarchaeota archaeon]|nr:hypothetical protein [Candidatus Bathyarchaeota archaeon]
MQAIRCKHPLGERDNDPRRMRHRSNDRFCILEGDIENFYLSDQKDSNYNDEIALLTLYWLERGQTDHSRRLWRKLHSRYDSSRGVLKMDRADSKRRLYPVYKVALLEHSCEKNGGEGDSSERGGETSGVAASGWRLGD